VIYYSCKGVRAMDYTTFIGQTDNAKTIFVAGVFSALTVDTASDKLKIEWIEKELKQLHDELQKINKAYDDALEAEGLLDPFEGLEVK
jgi:hypothetical protein